MGLLTFRGGGSAEKTLSKNIFVKKRKKVAFT